LVVGLHRGKRYSLKSQDFDTAKVEYDRLCGGGDPKQKTLTLKDGVREYTASEPFKQLAASTQFRYRWCFDKHILPYLGNRPLKKVRASEIVRYIEHRQSQGAASNTVLKDTTSLSALFQYCVEHGYCEYNFVRGISAKPKKSDVVRPYHTPTEAEINKLIAELHPSVMDFFLTLSNTGARQAEISNTNIGDFDRDLGTLRVIRKGGKPDILCLNDLVKSRIENAILRRTTVRDVLPTEPLFLNKYGDRLQSINHAIASACKRANVPRMSHHSLRHGYATICFEQGMQPTDVANLLGNSLDVCMAIYVKWQSMKKKELARNVTFGSVQSQEVQSQNGQKMYK
jgi:site-specific recombinase XerD